jgi:transcriptional regulator with XRE-family HTH domain
VIERQIGARLAQVRALRLLSQADVARALGYSRGRWSMYESGQRGVSVFVLIAFHKLTGCDLHLLVCPEVRVSAAMRKYQREDALREKSKANAAKATP